MESSTATGMRDLGTQLSGSRSINENARDDSVSRHDTPFVWFAEFPSFPPSHVIFYISHNSAPPNEQ